MTDELKPCRQCGNPIKRKRYNGRLESLPIYNERKYCGATCSHLGRRIELQQHMRWDHDPVQRLARESRDALLPLNKLVAERQHP